MKKGIIYWKYQETKTGRSINQLEPAFVGHVGAKKTEVRIILKFFWPRLCQVVIDSAVPVMCAKEQSRRVLSRDTFTPKVTTEAVAEALQ